MHDLVNILHALTVNLRQWNFQHKAATDGVRLVFVAGWAPSHSHSLTWTKKNQERVSDEEKKKEQNPICMPNERMTGCECLKCDEKSVSDHSRNKHHWLSGKCGKMHFFYSFSLFLSRRVEFCILPLFLIFYCLH